MCVPHTHTHTLCVHCLTATLQNAFCLKKRPAHGVKLCWRDKVRQDLKSFGIPESSWYARAQERSVWRDLCHKGLFQMLVASTEPRVPLFECTVATISFGDLRILQDTSVTVLDLGLAADSLLNCVDEQPAFWQKASSYGWLV